MPSCLNPLLQRIPSFAIHEGSESGLIALHLICLALALLGLLESGTLVAILVSKITACLRIALIHHIRLEPFIEVFFFVLIEVVGIDLTIEVMVSSTSTTVAT